MKKHRNYVWGGILAIITTILLAGCNSGTKSESGESQKVDEPITVNVSLNGNLSRLTIGREKGFFEEEFTKVNAEIKWSEFQSGPPLLESLAANRVDLSFLGDGALISSLDKNLPFEVIGQTSENFLSGGIVVHPNSKIKTVEDLKGKSIGVALGTSANIYLVKALKLHGLTLDDVKIINLQPDDAQSAFGTNQLDAWTIWEPFRTGNIDKGIARELNIEENLSSPGVIIARTGFAEEHPEIVEAYLRAYKKTADWQIANPDEAAKIFEGETKVPAETIKKIIMDDKPNIFLTEESIQSYEDSIEKLVEIGYIKKAFNFEELINNQYIDEAFK
ncbi:aliphatic sulfonate ABC transporter substrate-binding protein [Bacillus sp. 37MA]|uniref:ABC transporter substrate-binding protein n=1 Tax=Bacillus sp. 37MA TaxID=1132442 RepID=UPI0003658AAF|nr:aliphatic sulfonate ABC transporter substrate-binding protein [Bacillus sp. 37MA]